MKGYLSSEEQDVDTLVDKARAAPGLVGRDLVSEVTCRERYTWDTPLPDRDSDEARHHVVAIDYGTKYNILRGLVSYGCRVTVVPAGTSADDILALDPDGIFLSNGPGDPSALDPLVATVRTLMDHKPMFGICLGHQLIGRACGGTTSKLKFGHHGANQPVQRLDTGQVEITSQNHGFTVDIDSIREHPVEVTHINLNDRTLEGMAHKELPVFSVQHHPEAAAGPHDSRYLFQRFVDLIEQGK